MSGRPTTTQIAVLQAMARGCRLSGSGLGDWLEPEQRDEFVIEK